MWIRLVSVTIFSGTLLKMATMTMTEPAKDVFHMERKRIPAVVSFSECQRNWSVPSRCLEALWNFIKRIFESTGSKVEDRRSRIEDRY
jgi:hypothetical protein